MHLRQRRRHCPIFTASQRHGQLFITPHKQQTIKLPFMSSKYLKSAHWLPRPHERRKALLVFGIATTAADNTESKQDAFMDDEAFTAKQSALNSGIETEEPLTPSDTLLPLVTDDNAYPNTAEMLVLALQPHRSSPTQIAHTYNAFTHAHSEAIPPQNEERILKRKSQQLTYLFAALASSVGITFLAGASVYYRFAWQVEGGEVPWTEMFGTFSLALGAAVGMEYWARWAHRVLWHASLWSMHESHHQPRDGPFELNDVFAIINAIPAIALMAFGFLHKGLVPGLCFGAGLGITVFGIAYMFVHDGLVHRRFPVGPIADVPYFQKVAAAHQLHHAETFNGVPYGLFLGPMELEEVGGRTELEKLLQKRKREKTNPIQG
ncbi:hypothetical protein GOP47_0022796 [Adiantum capillus-veneris]|uniref:beta-carotene 3-hydroxylase n=1 Tax=Adiantum capillus-veneris TaxID=13818 RepID=A0A9D4Z6C0_ADICA|nr:hypothetical protein GOP47_0022796 [Adiantum capillus-veneris]